MQLKTSLYEGTFREPKQSIRKRTEIVDASIRSCTSQSADLCKTTILWQGIGLGGEVNRRNENTLVKGMKIVKISWCCHRVKGIRMNTRKQVYAFLVILCAIASQVHSFAEENNPPIQPKPKIEISDREKVEAETANIFGLQLSNVKDPIGAFKQFSIAIKINPAVPDYHNNAGNAVLELGRPLDAIEYFNKAIEINPNIPQPYMNIGRCYAKMDKGIDAQTWYAKAREHDKDGAMWDLDWMIGREHVKRGEFKLALECFERARIKAEKHTIKNPDLLAEINACKRKLEK